MVLKHEEKEIRRLLELNDYFGLKPENVRIFHQPTLPCYDGAGQIAFACADPPRLASAPNGDGGVIGALTKVCRPLPVTYYCSYSDAASFFLFSGPPHCQHG